MADFDADSESIFADLTTSRGLLLAVSGGPDSVALLLMIDRWRHRSRVPVAVATVDHGFRPEAAEEAASVAALCTARDLPHHILAWNGDQPRTRIQERAREGRYALLVGCAEEIGADTIVTAHHADDQAETVLMRLTRGSGVAGLAGMASLSRRGGVHLARPLLGVAKADLVALCRAKGVAFAEDPGNRDPRFRRTGLRRLAATLTREGLDGAALRRLGRRAGLAEEALHWAQERADEALPVTRRDAETIMPAKSLSALPVEIVMRLLASALEERGRRTVPARRDRLEALEGRLRTAIVADASFDATLGGCTVRVRQGEVRIAAAPPRRPVPTQSTAIASASRYLSSTPLLGKAGGDA